MGATQLLPHVSTRAVGACQETDVNPGWTTIYDGSLDPNVKQLRTRHDSARRILKESEALLLILAFNITIIT